MEIIGNGVDIVENKRIKNSLKIKGFINRVFTKNEINNLIKTAQYFKNNPRHIPNYDNYQKK